jgi:HD-like signal output (HDOD) protein
VKEESKQIESIVAKGETLVKAEHMVLGTDHAEIGALILQNWSFPDDIVDAVRWHHDPEYISTMYKRLKNPTIQSDIVYISNLIFESNAGSDSVDGNLSMPPPEVLKRLRINLEQYKAIAEKALIWMHKLSENLSFE